MAAVDGRHVRLRFPGLHPQRQMASDAASSPSVTSSSNSEEDEPPAP